MFVVMQHSGSVVHLTRPPFLFLFFVCVCLGSLCGELGRFIFSLSPGWRLVLGQYRVNRSRCNEVDLPDDDKGWTSINTMKVNYTILRDD